MTRQKARWALVLLALIVFLTVFIWSTIKDPADAAVPSKVKCPRSYVTTTEWSLLEVPMPAKKARAILDGPGMRVPHHPHMRYYNICGHENAEQAQAVFWFNRGRLVYGAWYVVNIHMPVEPTDPVLDPIPAVCTDAQGEPIPCDPEQQDRLVKTLS